MLAKQRFDRRDRGAGALDQRIASPAYSIAGASTSARDSVP
jgi:hypothetical protein